MERCCSAPGAAESTIVTVTPERILDTRDPVNVGLAGPFVSAVSQKLQVTGSVATTTGTKTVVPTGATGVLLNVTAAGPSADGFISVRPGNATGAPATSSLNVTAGVNLPNAVQVSLPTAGANAGQIDITFDAYGVAGPTTDILIDVVGYMTNTGLQELVADVATKANTADVYTQAQVDAAIVARSPIARNAREGDVGTLSANSGTVVLSVTIDAPVAGIIQVVGSALIDSPVAAGSYRCHLTGSTAVITSGLADTDRSTLQGDSEAGQCSTKGAIPVAAGTHTINLELGAPAAATSAYDDATLDAVFIPGGTVVATSAEVSASSDD